MHLGGMLDLGVPFDVLRDQLARLELAHEFELVAEPDQKFGIHGTKATIRLAEGVEKPHRHLSTINQLIDRAGYGPDVARIAKGVFKTLGVAEAKVHQTDIESIHFHEVGATDSIADIVGAAIGLDWLNLDRITCGTVELGGGMVRCEHGLLPVPAPATAEILKGIPTSRGRVDSEATTPTGAAILKTVVDEFSDRQAFNATLIGYGIGQKDFRVPNALRMTLAEGASRYETEVNVLIECNIDDMPAESFQPLQAALLAGGAKDVFFAPIVMKKTRPATKVSVLAAHADADALIETIFLSSTTIGVRTTEVTKQMLPRREATVPTSVGEVAVKFVTLPNGQERWKIEHDDIERLATSTGKSYFELRTLLEAEIARSLS